MALSDQELKEIAYLARINVSEDSLSSLKKELEDILDLFQQLNEADTSEVNAMSHPLDLSQPTRKENNKLLAINIFNFGSCGGPNEYWFNVC